MQNAAVLGELESVCMWVQTGVMGVQTVQKQTTKGSLAASYMPSPVKQLSGVRSPNPTFCNSPKYTGWDTHLRKKTPLRKEIRLRSQAICLYSESRKKPGSRAHALPSHPLLLGLNFLLAPQTWLPLPLPFAPAPLQLKMPDISLP